MGIDTSLVLAWLLFYGEGTAPKIQDGLKQDTLTDTMNALWYALENRWVSKSEAYTTTQGALYRETIYRLTDKGRKHIREKVWQLLESGV